MQITQHAESLAAGSSLKKKKKDYAISMHIFKAVLVQKGNQKNII